jgi:hypothetical protein
MTRPKSKKTKRLFNNHDLMEEFLRLDKLYFGGKLPMPLRIAFEPIDGLGHTFRFRTLGKRRSKDDRFGIHISPKIRFSKTLWLGTLIHECVHLEQRNKYSCGIRGKHFNNRMRELSLQGAFDGIR